jgi:ABC-type sugar transport system substrate-binding protein
MKVLPTALVAMLGLAVMPASLEVPKVLAAGPETTAKLGLPKYKFAVITHSTAVAFFVPIRKGAEDAGQLLGAEVTYTGPPDFNIQKQVDFIKSAIAQNVVFGVEEVAGSAIAQIIDRDQLKGKVAGGSFDLVPEVLDAIEKGELQFTMDQQPYLQGYLSVINLYLLKRYSLTPTNINTGTVPVTWENVAKVKELVTQGYR